MPQFDSPPQQPAVALKSRMEVVQESAERADVQHGQPRPVLHQHAREKREHGGFGFAEEYDIERKFRETRLYSVAPISTNLILSYLAEHVLGLPRSY